MTAGTVFDIKRYAIHDGPGVRTTVFLKGCPLRCPWCHNPEGQNPDPETMIPAIADEGHDHTNLTEVVGRVLGTEEVMDEIERDLLFFEESGGGVTFSGGEPLAQPEFLVSLLDNCKENDIHTALDTSGYASPEVFASFVDRVALFLYDLKLMNDELHQKYTGVSNRLILRNLKTLTQRRKSVVIRFLVIPEITDSRENINDAADFVASLEGINDVSLLPYHTIAREKYSRLRRKNEMEGVPPPTRQMIESIRATFESRDIRVTVGA